MLTPLCKQMFPFDPDTVYLDHGAYGAVPLVVKEAHAKCDEYIARNPSRFFHDEQPIKWREIANLIARRFGAEEDDVAIVDNVTTGANAVFQSLSFQPGDEILSTSLSHGGLGMALDDLAKQKGLTVVKALLRFPDPDPQQCIEAVASALTPRTKLAIFDHITSKTALMLPVTEMTRLCHAHGVAVLIDGAHVPGNITLDLPTIGADWYVANLHKWHFAHISCGFLWAKKDKREKLRPAIKSYEIDRPFPECFKWPGTRDALPWLSVEAAFGFMDERGTENVLRHNHALIREAVQLLSEDWGQKTTPPHSMISSMSTLPLPSHIDFKATVEDSEKLQHHLWDQYKIQCGVACLEKQLYVRVSAQIYNSIEDYTALARAIKRA